MVLKASGARQSLPVVVSTGALDYAAWLPRTTLHIRADSGGDRIDVQYETLCQQPNETMAAILAFIGIDASRTDHRGMIGAHASRVAPEIARERAFVVGKLSDYASAVGYDLAILAKAF